MIIKGVTGVEINPFNHLHFESKSGPKPGLHLHHSDETDSTGGGIRSSVSSKVQKYIKDLKDKDVHVRINAAIALGGIGKEAALAVPALIKALKDESKYVRINAAFALGEIEGEAASAVPALIEALKDTSEDVRRWAAFALEKIGAEKNQISFYTSNY
ncbi:MAG: HEAT repeat domain-containing protein [Candidatus Melainabacteria bacterium]|nr:HEAT repeat domain-containing protein [Candidatus Melainabacteria bacterium]